MPPLLVHCLSAPYTAPACQIASQNLLPHKLLLQAIVPLMHLGRKRSQESRERRNEAKKAKRRAALRAACSPTRIEKPKEQPTALPGFEGYESPTPTEAAAQHSPAAVPTPPRDHLRLLPIENHMRLELPTVHSDDHIRLVFKDEVAFTEGCGSFVDAFDTANREHHVKRAPVGKILHAYNEHNDEVYAIEGGAAQAEGLDMRDIYGHIQQLPDIAATNMATGEYRGVRGYGFVGGVGLRYLYTAKKKYGQQFVGQWATRPGRAKQARDLLHTVQHCGNKTVARVQKWGFPYEDELKLQRKLMDKICQYNGTASFTFPSAMIGVNGGYGVHKDKRDVQRTLWLVTGTGALVFPNVTKLYGRPVVLDINLVRLPNLLLSQFDICTHVDWETKDATAHSQSGHLLVGYPRYAQRWISGLFDLHR